MRIIFKNNIPSKIISSFNLNFFIQFKNNILQSLSKLGLTEDDIDVPLQTLATHKAPASVLWYMDGHRLYYSYGRSPKFVENLYVVSKIIELEVQTLLNEEKTFPDFLNDFSEEKDVEDQRKEARALLGLAHDVIDVDLINSKFRALAKEHHPDRPNGDAEKFKAINLAHKILKRELE